MAGVVTRVEGRNAMMVEEGFSTSTRGQTSTPLEVGQLVNVEVFASEESGAADGAQITMQVSDDGNLYTRTSQVMTMGATNGHLPVFKTGARFVQAIVTQKTAGASTVRLVISAARTD